MQQRTVYHHSITLLCIMKSRCHMWLLTIASVLTAEHRTQPQNTVCGRDEPQTRARNSSLKMGSYGNKFNIPATKRDHLWFEHSGQCAWALKPQWNQFYINCYQEETFRSDKGQTLHLVCTWTIYVLG